MRPIPIGIDDFRMLREQGLQYVDKSHLVREVFDQGSQVLSFLRPRRFGKPLNLSMLRYFLEKRDEDLSGLFAEVADPVADELEAVLEMRRSGADAKALRRALRRIEELLDE